MGTLDKFTKYKIVGFILNPFDEEQKRQLAENYEEVASDYEFVTNENNPFEERKNVMSFYPIDGNIENWLAEEDYIIDEDNDGVYLLKKVYE